MRPYKSVTSSLLGVAIGIFGLSVSIVGLATNAPIGTVVGAMIALVGLTVALTSALSVKE